MKSIDGSVGPMSLRFGCETIDKDAGKHSAEGRDQRNEPQAMRANMLD